MSTRQSKILEEVADERAAQEEKWGEQNHPDGTGPYVIWPHTSRQMIGVCGEARNRTDARATRGNLTYLDIFLEEVFEAAAEDDVDKLRAELIQSAAVAVAWIEKIDRGRAVVGT